jgi:predicted nucleic acid-binding protein
MISTDVLDTTASVVVDTCVLADLLFTNRDRHAEASKACHLLPQLGKRALVPAHGFFELVSVVFAERHRRSAPLELASFAKSLPFELDIVDINLKFIESHLIAGLSDREDDLNSSGGDMVYLALALGQAIPLITEDNRLRVKASRLGISAYTSREFVNAYQQPSSGA